MLKKVLSLLPILAILVFALGMISPVSATAPTTPVFNMGVRVKAGLDYDWNITKVADQTQLTLAPGQQQLVNYTVVVSASPAIITAQAGVAFNVYNGSSEALTIKSITFTLDGSPYSILCLGAPPVLPAVVTPGTNYTCQFPGGGLFTFTNPPAQMTAQATFVTDGGGLGNDITSSVSRVLDFTNPDDNLGTTDNCVTVNDDQYGSLGSVCANESPKTFTYSMYVGPYEACGDYSFINTATFVTNSNGSTGSASATVNINVPCAGGCSLTPGYWKTHSSYGPAPFDDTWNLIGGADAPFFLSNQSYYQVLWTSPQGNAYYILAHAFIAAQLNQLNGADVSPISTQMAEAMTFFNSNTPLTSLTKAQRNAILNTAAIIDNYNNGLIGPGHCSE